MHATIRTATLAAIATAIASDFTTPRPANIAAVTAAVAPSSTAATCGGRDAESSGERQL